MDTSLLHEGGTVADNVSALVFTSGPRDSKWGPYASDGEGNGDPNGLLGWTMRVPLIDAGMPPVVAGVVSRALCSLGALSFCHSSLSTAHTTADWRPDEFGWQRRLTAKGFKRVSRSQAFPMRCTSLPEVAMQLFFDDEFGWERRGQLAFLSARTASPPRLSHEHVWETFERKLPAPSTALLEFGVMAIMSPGVDGDFAEFITHNVNTLKAIEQALARESQTAGLPWRAVTETEFASTRW